MAVEIDEIPSAKSIGWTDALLSRLAANSVGLGGRLSITAPANASALSSTGYSLTGSDATSMIDLAGTWNTSGTPTAVKLNVTDTASNAASLLMDLQVGGLPRYSFGKTRISLDNSATNQIAVVNGASLSVAGGVGQALYLGVGIATFGLQMRIDSARINIPSTHFIGWSSDTTSYGTTDVSLFRDAANTLALRNAANAQTFNVYGTYTSASVYERGAVYADSNGFNIAHQQLGATKRPVRILGHDLASAEAVSALEINQTWDTSGNPVGLKMAITNTNSGATSKFISLLAGVGGATEVFSVSKAGVVAIGNAAGGARISFTASAIASYNSGPGELLLIGTETTASILMGFNPAVAKEVLLDSAAVFGWCSGTVAAGTLDTKLYRDAANTLALRNAANAQTFNVYGTWTSISVFERMFMRYSTGNTRFEIGAETTGGTAANTGLAFFTGGTARLTIHATTGNLAATNNGYFGAPQTTNWWTSSKVVQVGYAALFNDGTSVTSAMTLSSNHHGTGSGSTYIGTGFAAKYEQYSGEHVWHTAPSGTAGNAITYTERMRLTNAGLLQMDKTTDDAGFINFKATADADATSAISTLTTSGAVTHHIQIQINGVTAWIPCSTTDPS